MLSSEDIQALRNGAIRLFEDSACTINYEALSARLLVEITDSLLRIEELLKQNAERNLNAETL